MDTKREPMTKDSQTLLSRAVNSFNKGDDKSAIEQLRRFINTHPERTENVVHAHALIGNLLHKHGKYDEAHTHLQKALDSNPEYTEVHYLLGRSFHQQEQYGQAITHYRQTLDSDSDSNPTFPEPETHYYLGLLLCDQEQYEDAVPHLIKAFETANESSNIDIEVLEEILAPALGDQWEEFERQSRGQVPEKNTRNDLQKSERATDNQDGGESNESVKNIVKNIHMEDFVMNRSQVDLSETPEHNFCSGCGENIEDNEAAFCPYCGTDL